MVVKVADAASDSRWKACQAPQRLQGFSLLAVCHGASACPAGTTGESLAMHSNHVCNVIATIPVVPQADALCNMHLPCP